MVTFNLNITTKHNHPKHINLLFVFVIKWQTLSARVRHCDNTKDYKVILLQ